MHYLQAKDKIAQEHYIKACIDRVSEASERAKEIYEDKNSKLEDEKKSMSTGDIFKSFYERLGEIREYHKKFEGRIADPVMIPVERPDIQFSGEEMNGRYVDLHQQHELYLNLPGIYKYDYLSYLEKINDLSLIPRNIKLSTAYRNYLNSLAEYLCDYFKRIQPLVDFESLKKEFEEEFETKWSCNEITEWQLIQCPIDLKEYESIGELVLLGNEKLKEILTQMGLKCGGRAEERAERLFNTKDKKYTDLDPSFFNLKKHETKEHFLEEYKSTAKLEFVIEHYFQLVDDRIKATIRFVDRKQILSYEELQKELLQAEQSDKQIIKKTNNNDDEEEDDEEEKEEVIYNPLNLPIGWDGKPIPYWLWKLHGLGVEYKCEICGNHSYWGRRAFDLHFQEWRHAFGMKCLGIPNSKHFHDITSKADAIACIFIYFIYLMNSI